MMTASLTWDQICDLRKVLEEEYGFLSGSVDLEYGSERETLTIDVRPGGTKKATASIDILCSAI